LGVITLQGYIVVPDTDLASVQDGLLEHIELTQREHGCLYFTVSQDTENKNRFNVHEKFVNHAAFEAHQTRAKNSRWGHIAANVERYYQISEDS
jgi:autoinducer 2-degrading protein